MARTVRKAPKVIPITPKSAQETAPIFTEGHATRQAWAQGYPERDNGTSRLGVTIETHGIRENDGKVSARITIDQSDWPNADGTIEIPIADIPVLVATLLKAARIAEATGVFDPFTPWSDKE
jgi:hypothetical protein